MGEKINAGIGLTVEELAELARKWLSLEDPCELVAMGQSRFRPSPTVSYSSTVSSRERPFYRALAKAAGIEMTFSDEEGFRREQQPETFRIRYSIGERDCMLVGDGYNVAVYEKMLEIQKDLLFGINQHKLSPPDPCTEYTGQDFPDEDIYNTALSELSAELEVPYRRDESNPDNIHVGPTDRLEEFLAKVYMRIFEPDSAQKEASAE